MIKKITVENFRHFGRLIQYPDKPRTGNKSLFRIIIREPYEFGWRIAYLVVRDKAIKRLEQHMHTYESFEPVKGRSLLFLSVTKEPHKIECFLLDRPVVLYKGIWHGVVALGKESEIKITENARVKSLYWKTAAILDKRGSPPR